MAIWDDIAKKAAALSDKAVKQARDLSEVAKLKMQIAEAEKALDKDISTILGKETTPRKKAPEGEKEPEGEHKA